MTFSPNFSELQNELKKSVEGEVRFDAGARALYASDASNYRQIPIGLVVPRTLQDVIETLRICRIHGAPVLTRGSGTSLAGQGCNEAVIIDFSRHLNQILEIDPVRKIARVQPGVILDNLCAETRKHGLIFGPDPATHNRCTLGGMIGNNSCGVHSVMSGKTVENVDSLAVVTYDGLRLSAGSIAEQKLTDLAKTPGRSGEIYRNLLDLRNQYADLIRTRFPKLPRRVSGYNLEELLPENGFHLGRALTGTEGTCVTILEASVKLIPDFPGRSLLVLGYPDIYQAADDMPFLLEAKPSGLEGLDENFILNMKKAGLHKEEIALFPQGKGWLLVEFGGSDQKEANDKAQKAAARLQKDRQNLDIRLFSDSAMQKKIWSVRESSFGATVFVPGVRDTFAGFEDSAVPPAKLGAYLRELQKLFDRYDYYAVLYGHFGDGCIHSRVSFDLRTGSGIARYKEFQEEAADLVIRYGGSLSGEHGDGQTWGHLLHKMFGPEIVQAFRRFKKIWDPENKMNPGKVVDAYDVGENLRLKQYSPIETGPLHFSYGEEKGDFARTTERCIGIGKCLKTEGGTMCPSYMATSEEEHSTRGRAHLLHEMMRGEVLKAGWKEEAVKKSLDLCLACKACKSECPVKVDMAAYKAEFLAHYYKGRLRPLSAYGFGLIPVWARLAAKIPSFVNALIQNPFLGKWIKKTGGIAQNRAIPLFAEETFQKWFLKIKNDSALGDQPEVLLWPDTFNNYFYSDTAKAAVTVLEFLGYRVQVPSAPVCCGRPLYDSGMLERARKYLRRTLEVLRPYLQKEMPVIILEPSCLSVFRDETGQFFSEDSEMRELKARTRSFAEFLYERKHFPDLFKSHEKIIMHGHCHQKALWGMGNEKNFLGAMGSNVDILDAGCCGMAGAFGFEEKHYDLSIKVGERALFPKLRKADPKTVFLSDGFSCREQISQAGLKRPLHLAEFLAMLIKGEKT